MDLNFIFNNTKSIINFKNLMNKIELSDFIQEFDKRSSVYEDRILKEGDDN